LDVTVVDNFLDLLKELGYWIITLPKY